MSTTESQRAAKSGTAVPAASGAPYAQASHARVRERLLRVTGRVRGFLRTVGLWPGAEVPATTATERPRGLGEVAETPPPSLADLAAYTRAGEWVPGERHPWLEAAGKAYGYLVALPVSAALYAISLLIQRPGRLALASFVLAVVWLTT